MRALVVTSMVFVLLSSLVLAEDESEASKAAAAKISLLGGTIFRDETLPGSPVVGVNFFFRSDNREEQLKATLNVSAEKYLHLLRAFPDLRTLNFGNVAHISDEGIREISNLTSLTTLQICGTKITDSGMKDIARLNNLSYLDLTWTKITDRGLKEITGLHYLNGIELNGVAITNDGMKSIGELRNLSYVGVMSTNITDEGLKELRDLKTLRQLDIGNTLVTNAGLKELEELKNLEKVVSWKSKVTAAGRMELKKSHPNIRIIP